MGRYLAIGRDSWMGMNRYVHAKREMKPMTKFRAIETRSCSNVVSGIVGEEASICSRSYRVGVKVKSGWLVPLSFGRSGRSVLSIFAMLPCDESYRSFLGHRGGVDCEVISSWFWHEEAKY